MTTGFTDIGEYEASRMVCPSAGFAFTCCTAIAPLAPGLLSTSTGWPSVRCICSATSRAVESAPLPAAKPTTTRIGLDGNSLPWAKAPLDISAPTTVAIQTKRITVASRSVG